MNEFEMYSQERVESRNKWYRDHIETYLNSKYRRDREYGSYLQRFFREQDENPNKGYGEPLPYNFYFT